MVDVLLARLGFASVVVHREAVCATFGAAVPTACIVSVGAHTTSIACVDDGAQLAGTAVELPYGFEHIARALRWLLMRADAWPAAVVDSPANNWHVASTLLSATEVLCHLPGPDGAGAPKARSTNAFGHVLEPGSIAEVAPRGLFYPDLLAPGPPGLPPHALRGDPEEVVEARQASEVNAASSASPGDGAEEVVMDAPGKLEALHDAVVRSIGAAPRPELRVRLAEAIVLCGGGAHLPGLVASLEERVFNALPQESAVETIEVVDLMARNVDPAHATWCGGAVLGLLDVARDAWVQQSHWLSDSVAAGASARRLASACTPAAQLLWYHG